MAGEGVLLPTPGLLSGAEGQAADKCLLALPDGTGVMQIISMNGAKKKKNLCTILLQCRCKARETSGLLAVAGLSPSQSGYGEHSSCEFRHSTCCGILQSLSSRFSDAGLILEQSGAPQTGLLSL